MRISTLRLWAFCLAAVLALTPMLVMAQGLNPNARSAIENGAAAGAAWLSTASAPATSVVAIPPADTPDPDEPEVEEPEVEEPEVEEPEVEEPEVVDEPEVVEEPEVEEPELDDTPAVILSGDLEEYENEGLRILAPAEWDVTAMTMFGNLFSMEVPGSDVVGLIQGGDALDFPGVMAVIIMRTLPEFIVEQFGEGAVYLGTEVLTNPQDLPVVKIEFEADLEGMPMGGAFYTISPGSTAYIMIALAPVEEWPQVGDAMDGVAASIEFAPELISLDAAGDEAIYVVDADETLEIVLPAEWQAAATGDPALPILVVAPGYEYVGALTATRDMDADVIRLLDEAIVDGEVNQEIIDLVLDLMSDTMSFDEDSFLLDPEFNEIYVVRDELVLRLAGQLVVDEGIVMDSAIYVGMRRDGISALIVFGDVGAALDAESTLVEILDSLLFIR